MGKLTDGIADDLSIDKGINEDGSLRPGEYRLGELPVAAWNEDDIGRVAEWLATLDLDIGNVRDLLVGEYSISAEVIHRDPNGNAHAKGHCDGSTTQVATRYVDEEETKLEVFCMGCRTVFGSVTRKEAMATSDFPVDSFTNPDHQTACTTMVTRPL